jgi:nicotinate dehydrogenase subunit B
VADVEVNRNTGEVHVSRVVVGHDAGTMINPAGVRHQVHGNVVQTTSRALKERVRVDPATNVVASREWGSYPILNFREVPVIEVMLMPRQGEEPLGAGESSSVPGTAAIANAIFDATGVRFRQPPFTAEVVKAALNPLPAPGAAAPPVGVLASPPVAAAAPPTGPVGMPPRRKPWWAAAGALVAGLAGLAAAAFGWRPAIAPVAVSGASVYTAQTLERGRQLAALGDCVVCHTAPGGIANAGGRAMETPFGTVTTTNITPDPETGIGRWSFSAFQRAMREGISRDGRHLYPAFPYTAFTRTTDDDLMALYAYLMAQPPVRSQPSTTRLALPFSWRPLMVLWNALYLTPGPVADSPQQTAEWNRGAYLVDGLGHCAACHSPRGAFGAEKGGAAYLSGAIVDGWEAPALTRLNRGPVPWTEDALFRYLRFGHSREHGAATGPMAAVVAQLGALPDTDVRAMAHYLASFNASTVDAQAAAQAALARSRAQAVAMVGDAQQFFSSACGACHHDGNGPMVFGQNLPLALSSKLHSERPDNLLRVILEGVREPATQEVGFMPAFRDGLDDRQVAQLVAYMRQRFAPEKPAWAGVEAASARIRDEGSAR